MSLENGDTSSSGSGSSFVMRPLKKVNCSNLFAALDSAVKTKEVAVRWQGNAYVLDMDAAKACFRDLKREFELATNVKTTRQEWPSWDGTSGGTNHAQQTAKIPDDMPIADIPWIQRGHSVLVKGHASVSITRATDKTTLNPTRNTTTTVSSHLAQMALHRRKPAHERSLGYRLEGNEHYNATPPRYKAALEKYTQAVNALPDDAKALSNRSAAYARLGRNKESLCDADRALRYDPEWPKLWARKARAHICLKQFDEAVAAYGRAIEIDPSRDDYRENREYATEQGGSHERYEAKQAALKRAEEERRLREIQERPQREANEWADYEAALRQWDEERTAQRRHRRECVARWKRSTGATNELDKPVYDRGRSVHVDIFSRLRGACRDCACTMWKRDVQTMRNWSDTTVLNCEVCGCLHTSHEDCGYYNDEDPPPPRRPGTKEAKPQIDGVYAGVNPNTGEEMGAPVSDIKVVDDGAAAAQVRKQREDTQRGSKNDNQQKAQVISSSDIAASTARDLFMTEDVFGTEWGGRWSQGAGEAGQAYFAQLTRDGGGGGDCSVRHEEHVECIGYCRQERWKPFGSNMTHGNDTSVLFCRRCGKPNDAHASMRSWLSAWQDGIARHDVTSSGMRAALAHVGFEEVVDGEAEDMGAWKDAARRAMRDSARAFSDRGRNLEQEAYDASGATI